MDSLNFSYETFNKYAYIIRLADNPTSERKAQRCADSCDRVGQPWRYWDAYDGVSNPIQPPAHHSQFMSMIKVTDHYMTRAEVACALSHISLWAHCVETDIPLVVLEHDAVMVQPYPEHLMFNSIAYLGCSEQVKKKWNVYATPPHSDTGHNYNFMNRAHAYSIDPAVAKNMCAYVLQQGIHAPLDIMIRADIFPMHQMAVYAYDESDDETTGVAADTTIAGRPKNVRTYIRNDNLEN